jgi:hypothetical protein
VVIGVLLAVVECGLVDVDLGLELHYSAVEVGGDRVE